MPRPRRTPSRTGASHAAPTAGFSRESEAWVKRTLRGMTLEEKLGQLLMLSYFGSLTSVEGSEFDEIARQVTENHIGAVMVEARQGPLGLRRGQAMPTAAIANLLQARAKIPLLIAGDFERGTVMRVEEGTSFPHMMAVAAGGRAEDAETVGRITAIEARAAGVQWIFAPVADVNSNPENPIINVRSFGEDPKRVADFVAAYIRGVEENGALATAKHFPGHGDTAIDSHLALPTVTSDRAHINRVELTPFRAAFSAGVSTVMTGHLAVPALDSDATVPATLSRKIIGDLLRRRMGFDGLVVTDALRMGGVPPCYSPAEAAVLSILAGCDLLLLPPSPEAALGGLREAVASGRLPVSRIDEAVTRVLRAKTRVGLHQHKHVKLEALAHIIARPEFARAAADIADRGVTLLRAAPGALPLDATRPTRALLVAIAGDPDAQPGLALEQELRWRVDTLDVLRADTRFATIDAIGVPAPDTHDVTVVALFVRVADGKGSVGLPDDQTAFVRKLLASHKNVIVVCFGSPYLVARFPEAKTWSAVFSSADVTQRAAGRAIFGQIAVAGRIPVSVPGAVARGEGIRVAANSMTLRPAAAHVDTQLARAYKVLDRAVAGRAFPGAVLAVGHRGLLNVRAFGKQSYSAGAPAVTPETIYDAASLTKPVVTATLGAMLTEAGALDLTAPIARYLPEWAAGSQRDARAQVTVRHLLTHTSGLPAHREYFKGKRRDLVAEVLAEPLVLEPGAQSVYSDLGFMLLGTIVERLTGRPIDRLAVERIFNPLGMADTTFNPPRALRDRIAPTENDLLFRKRLIRGEVHDENAWAMGGVAGHAGMFSTARDLAAFCQMILNGGIYAHQRLLRRATIAQFTSPELIAANTRTLGWMVPTPNSSSGQHFGAHGFGHTGFTGTSLWLDPEKQLFVVLLTNRVHPRRDSEQIQQVRPALHDAVVEGLGLVAGHPATP